jgi:hypothetical protein
MDRNFPCIYLHRRHPGAGQRAAKVRIAYSREREERRSKVEGEWICQNVRSTIRHMRRVHDLVSMRLTA